MGYKTEEKIQKEIKSIEINLIDDFGKQLKLFTMNELLERQELIHKEILSRSAIEV